MTSLRYLVFVMQSPEETEWSSASSWNHGAWASSWSTSWGSRAGWWNDGFGDQVGASWWEVTAQSAWTGWGTKAAGAGVWADGKSASGALAEESNGPEDKPCHWKAPSEWAQPPDGPDGSNDGNFAATPGDAWEDNLAAEDGTQAAKGGGQAAEENDESRESSDKEAEEGSDAADQVAEEESIGAAARRRIQERERIAAECQSSVSDLVQRDWHAKWSRRQEQKPGNITVIDTLPDLQWPPHQSKENGLETVTTHQEQGRDTAASGDDAATAGDKDGHVSDGDDTSQPEWYQKWLQRQALHPRSFVEIGLDAGGYTAEDLQGTWGDGRGDDQASPARQDDPTYDPLWYQKWLRTVHRERKPPPRDLLRAAGW